MKSRFSLNLGKPFGINVSVHWTFSLLIAWIVFISVSRGLEPVQILMHVLFIFALFGCVLLHELGHSLAAIKLGGKVESITLLPIGGMANMSEMPEKPREEFLVSAAGPLVNIIIAALIWIYITGISPADTGNMEFDVITANNFLVMLLAANLFIVAFNLIPAFPMDGGRLFRSALSINMSRIKATRIAKDIGQVFAIIFIFAGFFLNPFLIVIGFFIFLGARGEYEMMRYQDVLKNYTVTDILKTDYEEMDWNDTLGKAAEKLVHTSGKGFVITSDERGFVNILSKNDLIKGLNSLGKDGKIKDVINDSREEADSGMSLFDAFKKMQVNRFETLPVVDNGRLRGIVDMESIHEFFMIQAALH